LIEASQAKKPEPDPPLAQPIAPKIDYRATTVEITVRAARAYRVGAAGLERLGIGQDASPQTLVEGLAWARRQAPLVDKKKSAAAELEAMRQVMMLLGVPEPGDTARAKKLLELLDAVGDPPDLYRESPGLDLRHTKMN